jgi:hypothetical protein
MIASTKLRAGVGNSFRMLWPAWLMASLLIFWGFTWSLPDHQFIDKSFHADENAAVWAVDQIRFPGFNPHLFDWGTALFYPVYMLKLLVSLGGLIPVGDAGVLLIGRIVVWASAMGVLALVFLLGRELFDASTGRLAAILLSVIPGFVISSHYFKTDTPMLLWALAALYAGYRLVATSNIAWVYALGFFIGYSSSTKYSGATLIPAGLVFLAMTNRSVPRIRALVIFGACVAAGFLIGTPRVLPDPREFLHTLSWVRDLGRKGAPGAIARGPAWIDYLTRISQLALTLPMYVAAAVGGTLLIFRRGKALLPIWVFLIAYAFLMSADNARLLRYVVPLLPIAALFVAALVSEIRRANRAAGQIATLAAFSLIAYLFLFTASYVRVMAQEDPRVQAGRWIAAHVSRDLPFPVSTAHYLGAPQVQLWGYKKLDADTSLEKLRTAESPYLAVSEYITNRYDGALPYFPDAREFFEFIRNNYTEVIHFENSQRLLGVDSKSGLTVTHDWLYPNPRITIYLRKDSRAVSALR